MTYLNKAIDLSRNVVENVAGPIQGLFYVFRYALVTKYSQIRRFSAKMFMFWENLTFLTSDGLNFDLTKHDIVLL